MSVAGRVVVLTSTLALLVALMASPALAQTSPDGHMANGETCWTTSGDINGIFHSRTIGCIPNNQSQPQPTPTKPAQPVQAQPVQPVQAQPVQPVQPQPVQQVQGQPIQAPPAPPQVTPDFFLHTYALRVPGAAWTTQDLANWTETTYVAPGVPNTGGITIKADSTYVWNDTWEERVIEGQWEPTTDNGYSIKLLSAEANRDWLLGLDTTGSAIGTDIIVWGQQSLADQYRGTPVD